MISEGRFDSLSLSAIMGELFTQSQKSHFLLSVTDGTSEKLFLFEDNTISLLSLGPRKQALLGDLLVQTRRITEEQLREALEEQKHTKDYLGGILVSKGYIKEGTVSTALVEQLYEELFDLITWENASYKFEQDGEKPNTDLSTLRMTKCEYNRHLLALEVGKHLENWERIRDDMPGQLEVLVRTNDDQVETIASADPLMQRLLRLIDGLTPIGPLAVRAGLSLFRTSICIDKLLELNLVRLQSAEEIRNKIIDIPHDHPASTEWDLEESADAVERREIITNTVESRFNVFMMAKIITEEMKVQLLNEDPGGTITGLLDGTRNIQAIIAKTGQDDINVCRTIGRLLRNSFILPATASDLREFATDLQIKGDLDSALSLLKWAYRLTPNDPELLQDLAIVAAAKGNRRLASSYYRKIAELSLSNNDHEQAIIALNRVAELSPESHEVNAMLAKVYLLLGEEHREQALTEFAQALAKLTICGLHEKSRVIVEQLLDLVPDHDELRSQLLDISVKINADKVSFEGICPQCKKEVLPNARECTSCGLLLYHQCMTCGTELKIGTYICPNCGKDPYSLPAKGQKGYTIRMKKVESKGGVISFKLFDALDIARKSVADKQFNKAIESIQEAQKLQPYNEVLRTELEEIKKLAEEHEKKVKEDASLAAAQSTKQFAKRFAKLLLVAVAIVAICGGVLFFLLQTGEDEKQWELLAAKVLRLEASEKPSELMYAANQYKDFVSTFPNSKLALSAQERISSLFRKYETIAQPAWSKIEPYEKFKAPPVEEILVSLKKDDIDGMREIIKDIREFVADYPESAKAQSARDIRNKLEAVLSKLDEMSSEEVLERNANAQLEEAKKKVAAEGFDSAVSLFEAVVRDYPNTISATQAKKELSAYREFHASLQAVLEELEKLHKNGQYSDALARIDGFALTYPTAPGVSRIKDLRNSMNAKKTDFENSLREVVRKWEAAQINRADYETALNKLRDSYERSGWEHKAIEHLKELAELVEFATRTKQRADEEIKAQNYQQAFLLHKRLIESYSRVVSLENLVLYVVLSSEPSGAEVFVVKDNATESLKQTTPCIVPIPYGLGKGIAIFELHKKGYAKKPVKVEASEVVNNDLYKLPSVSLDSTFLHEWIMSKETRTEPLFINDQNGSYLTVVQDYGLEFIDIVSGVQTRVNVVVPERERPLEADPTRRTIAGDDYWRIRNTPQYLQLTGAKYNGSFIALPATNGRVYMFNAQTRALAGDFGLQLKYNLYNSIVFNRLRLVNDRTFAYFSAINGTIYCYDPETDALRWAYETGRFGETTLHQGGSYLYARLSSGRTLVLDYAGDAQNKSGILVTEFECDEMFVRENLLYSISGGVLSIRDASKQDHPILGQHDGKFSIHSKIIHISGKTIAYEVRTGHAWAFDGTKSLWRVELKTPLSGYPVLYDKSLVFASTRGTFFVVDADKGGVIREIQNNNAWISNPVVLGSHIYMVNTANELYVYDIVSSRLVWKNKDIRDKRIFVLVAKGLDLIAVTERAAYFFERILRD